MLKAGDLRMDAIEFVDAHVHFYDMRHPDLFYGQGILAQGRKDGYGGCRYPNLPPVKGEGIRGRGYFMGEQSAGSRSLFSCLMGATGLLGGQTPLARVSSRTCMRCSKLSYAHICTHLLSAPTSE